ncbi:beta-aspartyl-dipeptidase (metallo-type) [Geosporobacter subterraneus DSM 17957]|uniref:Isoaspartyl dipeptidase n=1 Tax=Geosporobacter subterraneus DSM 17957 TaxID=1121919 RepID=A0A1M6NRE3_9FIRM|nr:beta-aspartyl-peptidase [Geosporobacter subterraneus]SHJ98279.1 beta-aspartyl-dipeptidase (metallo-type) [Geosporobacter subterraneus DSM 17957]
MMKLVKGGEVYAPHYMGKMDLLLVADKIGDLKEEINIPDAMLDIEVIDASGKYVIPGLIDSHVHITGGGGEGGFKTRTPEIMLSAITKAGVTTVVGCLGTDGTTRCMKGLLAKARGLEEEGITAYIYTGSYQVPVRTITGSAMDDIILIDKVIGIGEIAISDHRSSQPTVEDLAKLAAEARVGGILSGKAGIVNIHLGDGARHLEALIHIIEHTEIPAAQFVPTHMNRSMKVMQKGIEYGKKGGIIDLTTSSDPEFLEEDEVKASTGLKIAMDAGVAVENITFSSDGQGSMPTFNKKKECIGLGVGKVDSIFREFRDAVQVDGVPMADALKVVTENPARILKLKNKGTIEIGKDADIVLVDQETFTVDTVIAKGKVMVKQGAAVVKGTFEE